MLYEYQKLLRSTGNRLKFLILLLLRCPFDGANIVINATFLNNSFHAVSQNNNDRLVMICLTYSVACLGLFLYNGTVWSIYAPFTTRMEGILRIQLFEKISRLSYERLESISHGEWITRLNTDVQMPFSRSVHLPHAVSALTCIAVSGIALWHMSPAILGYVLLFVIPHLFISQFFIARPIPKLNEHLLEATGRNTGDLNALLLCADTAAIYDGKEYLMKKFEKSSLHLLHSGMKIRIQTAKNDAILPLFGMGGYLFLFTISHSLIQDERLTFEHLVQVFQYRSGIIGSTILLTHCLVSIRAGIPYIKRLNQTLSEKVEETNG